MKITAVVVTFWKKRRGNVDVIVQSLIDSSRPPDHIIIWNNGEIPYGLGNYRATKTHLTVINSPYNFECRAKFVAAQLVHADYYIMCDDDTAVGPRTIEKLTDEAVRLTAPGKLFVTGFWGVKLNKDSFMTGAIIQPNYLDRPKAVDAFHGRVMVMNSEALAKTLSLEALVRDKWPTEGDDLIAGMANQPGSWVIPLDKPGEPFVELSEHGEAMQYAEGYFEMRDEFCLDVIEAKRNWRWSHA